MVTVDASVLVAAGAGDDPAGPESVAFLEAVLRDGRPIHMHIYIQALITYEARSDGATYNPFDWQVFCDDTAIENYADQPARALRRSRAAGMACTGSGRRSGEGVAR